MRFSANARLGPRGRQVMVERVPAGWPARRAAEAAGVSAQTCCKWVARHRTEGAAGLHDRRSPRQVAPAGARSATASLDAATASPLDSAAVPSGAPPRARRRSHTA